MSLSRRLSALDLYHATVNPREILGAPTILSDKTIWQFFRPLLFDSIHLSEIYLETFIVVADSRYKPTEEGGLAD